MPIIAKDVLHVGVVEYVISLPRPQWERFLPRWSSRRSRNCESRVFLFLGAVVIFGFATIVFGATTSFIIAWIAIATTGAADGVSTIIRNTIRQLQTPITSADE